MNNVSILTELLAIKSEELSSLCDKLNMAKEELIDSIEIGQVIVYDSEKDFFLEAFTDCTYSYPTIAMDIWELYAHGNKTGIDKWLYYNEVHKLSNGMILEIKK